MRVVAPAFWRMRLRVSGEGLTKWSSSLLFKVTRPVNRCVAVYFRGQFLGVQREERTDFQRNRRPSIRPLRYLYARRLQPVAGEIADRLFRRLRRVVARRILERGELLTAARLDHR